jgi:hypothetical protein
MLEERPTIHRAVIAVCERQGLRVKRVPDDHAGGKWRLSYDRTQGGTGTLELDLNFMLRTPLWEPVHMDSPTLLGLTARDIKVLDLHELAAGKLAALFSRSASRDIYDTTRIFESQALQLDKLRLAFTLYGAMNRHDWRTVSIDDITLSPREAAQMLVPMLRAPFAPKRADLDTWTKNLVSQCREHLTGLLPLRPHELQFLEELNGQGQIRPELLTDEQLMRERITTHPGLRWKALNVRKHLGLEP